MPRRFAIAACLVTVTLTLEAGAGAQETVRLFAAVSLSDVVRDALSDFEPPVVTQYGSSSGLARQIIAGAPADLFFSADPKQLELVVERGLMSRDAATEILSNELVVVVHRLSPRSLSSVHELVRFDRIAVADPAAVPAGVYAREYLERRGLWKTLQKKAVPTLDVRAALAAVASGNIPAGIVYRTDAATDARVHIALVVSGDDAPRIRYVLGALTANDRPEVRALYEHLRSDRVRAVFTRHGFVVLDPAP